MKLKLVLILAAIFSLTQCTSRNAETIGNDSRAIEKFTVKLGLIEKSRLSLPPIKGPSPLAQITRRKTAMDSIFDDALRANHEWAPLKGATPELDQRVERFNNAVQQAELDTNGSARIEESISASEFDEDEGRLREFLEGAYCLNLEAINKNEPPPSDDDYGQLLVHHMLKLPSNKEAELIRKARAFYKLGQRLEEEKLSESAFDAAVTGYCDLR